MNIMVNSITHTHTYTHTFTARVSSVSGACELVSNTLRSAAHYSQVSAVQCSGSSGLRPTCVCSEPCILIDQTAKNEAHFGNVFSEKSLRDEASPPVLLLSAPERHNSEAAVCLKADILSQL